MSKKTQQDLFKVLCLPAYSKSHSLPSTTSCLGCERSIPLVVCPWSCFELLGLFCLSLKQIQPDRRLVCGSQLFCLCWIPHLWSFYGCLNYVFTCLNQSACVFVCFLFWCLCALCLSRRPSDLVYRLQRNSWQQLIVWECWLWLKPWAAQSSTTWPKLLHCRTSLRWVDVCLFSFVILLWRHIVRFWSNFAVSRWKL